MRRSLKIIVASMVGLGVLYACGPIVAGVFGIGDREGPYLYPEGFHTCMYDFAYEARTGQEPESSLRHVLYDRPVFYGQPWRPKPIGERYAILAYFEVGKLPSRHQIREWNLEIDEEVERANGGDAEPLHAPSS